MPAEDAPLTSREAVLDWVAAVRAADRTLVADGTLARSSAWALADGALRHRSGRYFNVVGLEWREGEVTRRQPFIEQREIGTLGFIARRRRHGLEVLVHAKAEPGNVGIVQLAPTCQATASNRDRVHAGAPPPFSDYFAAIRGRVLSDTLQSEQGSRFLAKRNRNVLVIDEVETRGLLHRWIPLDLLRSLLSVDFLVNTDARSVLCCTDWRELCGRPGGDAFARALRRSLDAAPRPAALAEAGDRLARLRAAAEPPRLRPVEHLPGWRFNPDDPVIMTDGVLALRQIEAHCATREAPHWDQPIMQTLAEDIVELLCRDRDGVLEFGFRPRPEPGLLSGAELGPSHIRKPGDVGSDGTLRARVHQSDEGGRFYHTTAEYRIVEVAADPGGLVWLTLAEMREAMRRALFNNEARSALSVVLGRL
jgi:oxidase EvaA